MAPEAKESLKEKVVLVVVNTHPRICFPLLFRETRGREGGGREGERVREGEVRDTH